MKIDFNKLSELAILNEAGPQEMADSAADAASAPAATAPEPTTGAAPAAPAAGGETPSVPAPAAAPKSEIELILAGFRDGQIYKETVRSVLHGTTNLIQDTADSNVVSQLAAEWNQEDGLKAYIESNEWAAGATGEQPADGEQPAGGEQPVDGEQPAQPTQEQIDAILAKIGKTLEELQDLNKNNPAAFDVAMIEAKRNGFTDEDYMIILRLIGRDINPDEEIVSNAGRDTEQPEEEPPAEEEPFELESEPIQQPEPEQMELPGTGVGEEPKGSWREEDQKKIDSAMRELKKYFDAGPDQMSRSESLSKLAKQIKADPNMAPFFEQYKRKGVLTEHYNNYINDKFKGR